MSGASATNQIVVTAGAVPAAASTSYLSSIPGLSATGCVCTRLLKECNLFQLLQNLHCVGRQPGVAAALVERSECWLDALLTGAEYRCGRICSSHQRPHEAAPGSVGSRQRRHAHYRRRALGHGDHGLRARHICNSRGMLPEHHRVELSSGSLVGRGFVHRSHLHVSGDLCPAS